MEVLLRAGAPYPIPWTFEGSQAFENEAAWLKGAREIDWNDISVDHASDIGEYSVENWPLPPFLFNGNLMKDPDFDPVCWFRRHMIAFEVFGMRFEDLQQLPGIETVPCKSPHPQTHRMGTVVTNNVALSLNEHAGSSSLFTSDDSLMSLPAPGPSGIISYPSTPKSGADPITQHESSSSTSST